MQRRRLLQERNTKIVKSIDASAGEKKKFHILTIPLLVQLKSMACHSNAVILHYLIGILRKMWFPNTFFFPSNECWCWFISFYQFLFVSFFFSLLHSYYVDYFVLSLKRISKINSIRASLHFNVNHKYNHSHIFGI